MKSLKPFLAVAIVIGIIDDLGFVFDVGLLTSAGLLWMLVAALLWAATFVIAFQYLHRRALWLLLAVPLLALPLAFAVIGAGRI